MKKPKQGLRAALRKIVGKVQTGGPGVTVLFSGPKGSGKTMAAQVLASEFGVDLVRVDLRAVVSKYIGETEKNLDRIFKEAESSGAALLFDEADALFGKRSGVKHGHDRYANIEVAFLLQRLEEFRGLAILATNSRQNIDPAFLRRIRYAVTFPAWGMFNPSASTAAAGRAGSAPAAPG